MKQQQLHCNVHQEDIEFSCSYKGCKQPYLCLLCFQEHKKICLGEYKTHIKKFHLHSNETQATIAQIEAFLQEKDQLARENHQLATQMFTDIKQECQKHYSLWLKSVEGLNSLLPHHIHSDNLSCMEKKLDEIKKLNFAQADNVASVKDAKILEEFLASREVQHLQKIAHTLKTWTVCRDRLEGHKVPILHLIKNMEVKNFLGNCEPEANVKITKEAESLKADHKALLKSKKEALEQKILLNKKMQQLKQANRELEIRNIFPQGVGMMFELVSCEFSELSSEF